MDFYLFFKLMHVISAIVWLGGGSCMLILSIAADRAGNDAELVRVLKNVIFLASRVFVPAAVSTLVFGILMTLLAHSFMELWILIGLAGFAWTFAIGHLVIRPRAEQLGAMIEEGGVTAEMLERGRQLTQIAKFDYTLMFLIVVAMVIRPTYEDITILTTMAAIAAIAAFLFLRQQRRSGAVAR